MIKEKRCRRCKEQIKPAYDALMKFYPFTIDDLPGEVWQDLPDWQGYQVSNFGRVKSLKGKQPRIIKPAVNPQGYVRVTLSKDSQSKTLRVHRLVAQLFLLNLRNKPEVDHIDGNPLNNHVDNLRWATSTENAEYRDNDGQLKPKRKVKYNWPKFKYNRRTHRFEPVPPDSKNKPP